MEVTVLMPKEPEHQMVPAQDRTDERMPYSVPSKAWCGFCFPKSNV